MNDTSSIRRRSWQTGLAVFVIAASASLVSPAVYAQVRHGHFIGDAVVVQPPVPQVEVIGVAPHPGYIYQNGYWNWAGGKHVWVGGRWNAPRRGYYWEPHVWVHEGSGWRMREGYWARR